MVGGHVKTKHFRIDELKFAYPSSDGPKFQPHPVYSDEDMDSVTITHVEPRTFADKAAFHAMRITRTLFDTATGYGYDMTEKKYMTRFLFLETVAGVPPMVGGMARHLRSLRTLQRDRGWIHNLLEEAENERMHLMTFMELEKPGPFFRLMVVLAQGLLTNAYFVAYLLFPRYCHKFVGYLEEEAVKTYTGAIDALEAGKLPAWTDLPASALAKTYWQLPDDAKFVDVLRAIRADEAVHRDVNHTLASVDQSAASPLK